MRILIREADLIADRELLLNTLLHNRDQSVHDRCRARFGWSYYQNPFGKPRAWLAIDNSSSRIIGMSAAFPRRIRINGEVLTGWNTGDFSIDQDYRTLGVAIKLRRAVQETVNRGEMPFLYTYPVDRMRVVLEKTGHQTIGKFMRHGAVLRTDVIIQKILGRNPLAALLTKATNMLPPLQWNYRREQRGYRVRVQSENKFGSEYDDLYQRVAKNHTVMTVRDAAFLHWRFVQNPLVRDFRIFRLEHEGKLRGYAILGFDNDGARILDTLIDGDNLAIRTMLLAAMRWLRSQKICTLAFRAMSSSSVLAEARPLGFIFKNPLNSSVAVYSNSTIAPIVTNGKNWFMTQADCDL